MPRTASLQKPDEPRPAPGFRFGTTVLTMAATVLQTALIGWFGYMLSGRVELAVKERQTTIQAVKEMGSLVDDLFEMTDTKTSVYMPKVRKLVMYGTDAVPHFVMVAARAPGDTIIPISGLRLLALQHRDEVCDALGRAAKVKDTIAPERFARMEELRNKELKCANGWPFS